MASKERKKVSKSEKKRIAQERGRKGATARGVGVGSRTNLTLPAAWTTETESYSHHDAQKFISPGKTRYHSAAKVKEVLVKRRMNFCLNESSESSGNEVDDRDKDFEPGPSRKIPKCERQVEGVEVERQFVVCESTQITSFVEDINRTSRCSTSECNGVLVPCKVETLGLGGSIKITFACSGCELRRVSFQGTSSVEASRRTVVGLALAVAFIVSGHGFARFHRTLNMCLGIQAISKNRFFEVVKLIYPHIMDILCEMCDEAKEKMKGMDRRVLGNWKRGVVTSDGVWHTRGHFSKNGSFIIKNYLTGGLLWFGHKCMRGGSEDEDLFLGTAKSMEGILADECYEQAKREGFDIEVVWQDGDSSSQKSVEKVFGAEPRRVFKCGGHVGRAHANNLKDLSKQKVFSATQITKWKNKFPAVESAKCNCKRHSKTCGCLSDAFIQGARLNHFCCLQQCENPDDYARRMRSLGGHHCKDEHKWDDGECDFHPSTVCSCGKCQDDEISCEGKAYATKSVLKCEFHQLAYQTECELRANDAEAVIHPEMGRGQSNLCEAHFSVLPQFRAKDQSLCRLHYITSTNCGLAQGNMTWCFQNRGPDYHWVIDLYERLKLPILPEVVRAFQKATQERVKELEKKKTDEAKQQRISHKIARAEDQEERKKWVKRQAILHTYGADEAGDDGSEVDRSLVEEAEGILGGEELTIVSGKKCRCGSASHQRTSSTLCPLNKRNAK